MHMSAYDPKRTSGNPFQSSGADWYDALSLASGAAMRRRDFIRITVGTAVVWPLAAQGQKPDRVRRVSVLIGTPENDPETKSRIRAFRLGLRDAGWVEGRNIQIEFRYPGTD